MIIAFISTHEYIKVKDSCQRGKNSHYHLYFMAIHMGG